MSDLPIGWVWASLEHLTKRIGDIDHKMPGAIAQGIPYISTKNFYGKDEINFDAAKQISCEDYIALSRKIKPEKGDILLSRYGTIGEVRKVSIDTEFQASYSIAIIKNFSEPNLTDYLLYALRSEIVQSQIWRDVRATAQPDLGLEHIRHFKIPLPPLPEQHRIVAAIEQQFTRLDAGVAALQRAKAKLKHYRAAVLKAAVEGELTETWRAEHPTTEPASLLLEHILDERRAKWAADLRAKGKDPTKVKYVEPAKPDVENLPGLPEGWCYTFLNILLSITRKGITTGPFGSLLMKHEHQPEGVSVLGIENIKAMKFIAGSKIHITEDKAKQLSKYDAQSGDILISRSGTVGEICVVPEGLGEARISTNLMRVVFSPRGMLSQFFCLLFNGSPFVLGQVSDQCKGSTRDFLNQDILHSIIFPLPPLAEQFQILTEVESSLSIITQLEATVEANLKRAERLRQSILREAFAGRLVPQDPTDEPASVLLKRIHNERKNGHNANNKTSNGRHALRPPEPVTLDVTETEQAALWESIER